jgi:L-fuculose-phosphate aldolase
MADHKSPETAELKDKMGTAIAILEWELADMMGHVSLRTPDGKGFFFRHLRPPENPHVPDTDVIEYDLDGKQLAGQRWGGPGTEIHFYTHPYKSRPDVGAVIHVHPQMVIALTAAGRKLRAIYHRHRFGSEVPVTPWLYGSVPEDGELANQTMGENCAVIIKGHGVIVTGRTLEEACINAVQLERTAKMIMLAGGDVEPISPDAVKKFNDIIEDARQKSKTQGVPVAEWRYYERLVKRGERWARL